MKSPGHLESPCKINQLKWASYWVLNETEIDNPYLSSSAQVLIFKNEDIATTRMNDYSIFKVDFSI